MVYLPSEGRCYIKAVSPPLEPLHKSKRGEVVLMGNGRWVKALRFVVCFIIALLLMILTAQKAC